ncbi:MAG: nucleotidyltransferase family protein [Acidobacteriota bacterium]|nr:nucleotidyltransferase family protein [Acidobacteriota bacterium]
MLRAFGPPDHGAAIDAPPKAANVCTLLSLAPRVAARAGRAKLEGELGPEGSVKLFAARRTAAFQAIRVLACAERVAEIAQGSGIPLVFLKYMALRLTSSVAEGCRPVGDVDVLVPREQAERVQTLLEKFGFQSAGMPATKQHLPLLIHADLGAVEVHTTVPGVRVVANRSARYADLLGRGLLDAVDDLPGDCFTPHADVMLAHALSHGIAQHGHSPHAYPMMLMVADLVDLGFASLEPGRLENVTSMLARTLSTEEIGAARSLTQALVEGVVPPDDSDAGALLNHMLAGRLDANYAQSLKVVGIWGHASDRPAVSALLHGARQALFPTRAQIAVIYGEPSSELGYLARRVLRPFDLLVRLTRYLSSHRRASRPGSASRWARRRGPR